MTEEKRVRAGPQAVLEAEIAPVLRAMRLPLHSCGKGYRLTDAPQIYIEGPRWQETQQGSGKVIRQGGLVQLLVFHFGMRPEQALRLAGGKDGGKRMLPKDRLGLVRRQSCLQQRLQLFAGGHRPEMPVKLPDQDPGWEEALQRYLQGSLGLEASLAEELRSGGFVYAGRGTAVFPGAADGGLQGWYYVKTLRREEAQGRPGKNAHLFLSCPWMWGGKEATRLHVFDTPPEALRHLARRKAEEETPKQEAAWMALTEENNPAALFSCLLWLPRVSEIVLHLRSSGCSCAIQAELEAAADLPVVCRQVKQPEKDAAEEKKGGEGFDSKRRHGSYPQPSGGIP